MVFETGGFYDQAASFVADLRAGRRPADDLDSALQAVEIAECLRRRRQAWSARRLFRRQASGERPARFLKTLEK